MKQLGIQFFPPNYIFFDNFDESSIIVDVGCGHKAEFSRFMIKKHNLYAVGVDPTRKHASRLKMLEESMNGRFQHLAIAVTQENGFVTFHESNNNESGSILPEHTNMRNDEIIQYKVESLSLCELAKRIGTTPIDFLKLDIEGAEYDLLAEINTDDINLFNQIFIEFHHHCTQHSVQDTELIVQHICTKGFKTFTLDHHQYLFYK